MKQHTPQSGFVLLFAVLISSIVLAVGAGVFNITRKELILSRASRDSQFAFFAADTGAECAFFWDRKYFLVDPLSLSAFPKTTNPVIDVQYPSGVRCNNIDIVMEGHATEPYGDPEDIRWRIAGDATSATTDFILPFPDGSCAKVSVAKTQPGTTVVTTVTSTGQSICSSDDPNMVQRKIVATY